MNRVEKPLVYLILGAAGSGRREVLRDLTEDGLEETDRPAVMVSSDEPAGQGNTITLPNVTTWEWREGMIVGALPSDATHVFFVTDGTRNPVDQIEVFKAWIAAQNGELARIICIINSQLAEKHPPLLAWFEACVHFADIVLLNKREGVENKWMSGFVEHFNGEGRAGEKSRGAPRAGSPADVACLRRGAGLDLHERRR
jgi:hypothetical protein